MAKLQIPSGTTSKRIAIFIQDSSSTTGAGLTGLAFGSSGLVCYSWIDTAGNAGGVSQALQTATLGTWTTRGFVEKDATNLPGFYEFGIPDALLAAGVKWAVIMFKGATNMAPLPLEIEVTAVSNQDAVRGGMTALPNANAEAAGGLYTRGSGAGQINQPANGQIDANTVKVGGTVQTAGDIPARLPAALTANGNMKSSLVEILTTALTETAGQLAAAFKQWFNVAAPVGTVNSIPNATAGAAGGLFIAGVNAPVTISGAGTALTLTSTSGNGHGLSATGQGTGNGIAASGGATNASGVKCVGQGSGSGLEADASGATGHGLLVQGNTTGAGIFAIGGVDGDGIDGIGGAGGAVATHGIKGLAQSLNGCGLRGVGGPTGAGIGGLGGPTSGAGIRGAAAAGNSPGVEGTGFGSSSGIKGTGGATGVGFEAVGGATSGAGITATAVAGNSDGFTCAKAGTGVDIRGNLTGSVSSVVGNVAGSVVGSVASVTAGVTVTTNNDKTGYALTSGERTSVADALLDRDMSLGADTGSTTVRTVRQALRFLRNKWSISAGTLTVTKENDATTSWTGTVTTTAGNPVSTIDPA